MPLEGYSTMSYILIVRQHTSSSSSPIRVMNHNWSATKQRLHPQSVAKINVLVQCKNGSAETTVAEGGRNPVARLWGPTLGEN